mmetsp:Transcript_874/g.1440  ORF Transcript_874/g.1440 Transcript_874/m.1440 type:complete len:157 (-) Transcript_874:750-1220(-)|eukprot:CAMPEP_0184287924 /NCGR_PEP_ID=MMETSP1049-20130417/321_1 /TAXON_ID=77928 /ORGANISM="Proteomonas sulcata, Strain CCMP704" /LENGTH=156 /DNA_ID=CAMNT_0026594051 /DNA_START=332 /DNA_END=802 /DNA_ORIENTATION=-
MVDPSATAPAPAFQTAIPVAQPVGAAPVAPNYMGPPGMPMGMPNPLPGSSVPAPPKAPSNSGQWSSGICDCCYGDGMKPGPGGQCPCLCCEAAFCPCFVYGRNMSFVHPDEDDFGGHEAQAAFFYFLMCCAVRCIGSPTDLSCCLAQSSRRAIRAR